MVKTMIRKIDMGEYGVPQHQQLGDENEGDVAAARDGVLRDQKRINQGGSR
jgi:hypothetical protein